MTAEPDRFAIDHLKREILAGISARPDAHGVRSRDEGSLERFMTFDWADRLVIDEDLESATSQLSADTFARHLQRC